LSALVDAATWLEAHGCVAVIEARSAEAAGVATRFATVSRDAIAAGVDVVIAFGGDGTLLDAASAVVRSGDTPLVGVNLGTLGFLTEVSRDEMFDAFATMLAGRTRIETRLMLEGRVEGCMEALAPRLALNDIVVARGALARMIEMDVHVDGQPVCHLKADGVIIATATGSTAYNLSSGGPIVHPSVDALVVTPIAPHTLTQRPLVLAAGAHIELRPAIEPGADIIARFDGQFSVPLTRGAAVHVTRAPRVLRLLRTSSRTHFDVLREKLKWGHG
jgi:NAD+ kinase